MADPKQHSAFPFVVVLMVVVVLAIGFTVYRFGGGFGESDGNVESQKADTLPEFSLSDYNGRTVTNETFAGKIQVINSWASWCPFCVNELPDLALLQEEFEEDIVVIGINREESLETAKEFSDMLGITGRMVLLIDPQDSFYRSVQGFTMPETVFYDSAGNEVSHKRGVITLSEMRSQVEKMLDVEEAAVE